MWRRLHYGLWSTQTTTSSTFSFFVIDYLSISIVCFVWSAFLCYANIMTSAFASAKKTRCCKM
jgi:hypothetical protein